MNTNDCRISICENREKMELELKQLKLSKEKIILTGNGRVGKGALETLTKANIKTYDK